MSKLFSGKKYFLKPVKLIPNKNIMTNKSIPEEITELYSKKDQSATQNIPNPTQNINNSAFNYPKHYSPSNRSPVSLPPISGKNRKLTNSQQKYNSKKLGVSNSSANIYSASLFGQNNKKILKRDKTQVHILNNDENEDLNIDKLDQNLNYENKENELKQNSSNNNLNNITQINNITNINIHIHSGGTNKTVDNINNRELMKNLNEESNYNNNLNNVNILQNPLYTGIKNQKATFSNVTSSIMANNGLSILNNNPKLFPNMSQNLIPNKRKYLKGNIKIMPSFNNSTNSTKNTNEINSGSSLSTVGNMIMNCNNITTVSQRCISQNKDSKIVNNTLLPEIYTGRSSSIKKNTVVEKNMNNLLKEKGLTSSQIQDSENIDMGMNFLKDLNANNSTFICFLQLIQTHMDIELLLDSSNHNTNNYRLYSSNTISNDKLFVLNHLLNVYFDTLSMIYVKKNNNFNKSTSPIDNFFLYTSINNVFHKCIKIEICLNAAILITLSQLSLYEINSMIKNHFHKIIKEISNPLLNLFDTFIKDELNLNYPELITLNLRPDFQEHFNKLFKDQKITHSYKNSELLNIISKNVDKCVNSMKYYSTLNLKCSLIKPFGDSLNQLLYSFERKTLNQFGTVALKSLLFGELDSNRKISIQNCSIPINDNAKNKLINQSLAGLSLGSAIYNKINEIPPFLPPINPKYKYTLVLDMDETLIHYFFTHKNGMFFVRPYCFDFLYELNNLYEIITFTAGTKEYADNILNLLDINNNIIKYRLYRQHTTILGRSVFKDLSKLGRDLKKVIIIDNLKENFKMQPNNGIFIKTWTNDINDTQFRDLLKILKDIVLLNVDDVRTVIQKMNDENKISRNIINPYAHVNVAKLIGKINNFK